MSNLTDEQRKRMEQNRLKALEKRASKEQKSVLLGAKVSVSSTPQLNAYQVKTPQLNAYQVKAPLLNVNQVKAPQLNAPQLIAHQVKAPQVNAYQVKAPLLNVNQVKAPQLNAPQLSAHNSTKVPVNSSFSYGKSNGTNKAQSTFGYNLPKIDKVQNGATLKKNESIGATPATVFYSGKRITGSFILILAERFVVDIPYHSQAIEVFKTIPSKQYDVNTHKWSFCLTDHDKLSAALIPLRPAVCVSPLPSFVHQALNKSKKYPDATNIDLLTLDPLLLEAFMPFQREGVCFGVSRNGRVLIADDMGLGKTIQALGIASYYRQEWPMLILTPSSVRYAWVEALDRWISSVDSYEIVVANTGKDSLDGQVVIMSYDLLTKKADEIKKMNFQVVIMDESHMLKNFKTARYKAAAPIMKQARRVILLSGTPALSRPLELYTQISGIDSRLIPQYQEFGIRYCAGRQLPWGWDFSGSSNMEELQIILQATIMIRRLKSNVITQLPPKQRMAIILDPSSIATSTKAMEEAAKQFNKKILKGSEKHGALLQFFSQTANAKIKAVCDHMKELIENDKKFLIFGHHKIMLDKLSETCEQLKTPYIRIDGTTSSEGRQKLVDNFQTVAETKVAVLSITAASTGITLTAAQLVVFAELYWNPGFLVQAEDRVHRIGQVDSVLVQYLVAKGTADDYIWPLVQSKLDVLNKAGLSKDNFSVVSTSNQQEYVDDSIVKYFLKLNEEENEEFAFPDEENKCGSSVKRKRSPDLE